MSRLTHVHISVVGALANVAMHDEVYDTLCIHGKHCGSPEEYRQALRELLDNNILAMPVGSPCEGFSYQTGCPGHEVEDKTVTDWFESSMNDAVGSKLCTVGANLCEACNENQAEHRSSDDVRLCTPCYDSLLESVESRPNPSGNRPQS